MLRVQMRIELAKLHKTLGTTMIYVTHDQVEAMTLADRIVVLDRGVIAQIGAPLELYARPDNKFVASFIGSPTMNFLAVTPTSRRRARRHACRRQDRRQRGSAHRAQPEMRPTRRAPRRSRSASARNISPSSRPATRAPS